MQEKEIIKSKQEKELVFNTINKNWIFTPTTLSPESQEIINNWNDWRLFTTELYEKPKGTMGAFQRKTKALVQKAETLNNAIPLIINTTQTKSRLTAIITKVKALQNFMNLDRIPEKRVIPLISDLNIEIISLQQQIEETIQRSHIQKEEGEQEMINKLKTSK
jgi:hypothetical protein